MRYATLTIILALLLTGTVLAAGSAPALAVDGAVSVSGAHAKVHAAALAVARAEARLREAKHVESATRLYSGIYGAAVGRWVWTARRVGWHWSEMGRLMLVVRTESGGNPAASNGICRGLLQIHECHAAAFRTVTGLPYFNGVYVPRANLRYGLRLWRGSGWGPWVVMQ